MREREGEGEEKFAFWQEGKIIMRKKKQNGEQKKKGDWEEEREREKEKIKRDKNQDIIRQEQQKKE